MLNALHTLALSSSHFRADSQLTAESMDIEGTTVKRQLLASFSTSKAVLLSGLLLSTLTATSFIGTAHAREYGVRIVDNDGTPVAGASVCFGLPGNYSQFGAMFTDVDGQALVDIPDIPFVVTVSKTRFSGVRINQPAGGFNLIRQVTLTDSVPGPRCKAGSTLAENDNSSVQVTNVDVIADNQATQLALEAAGFPTDYRVSVQPDMSDSTWQSLGENITLTNSQSERDLVYLQLRRYETNPGGWLEALSRPVTVYLPLSETRLEAL